MIKINVLDVLGDLETRKCELFEKLVYLRHKESENFLTRHEELLLAEYEGRYLEITKLIKYIDENMGD
jgi:hypothetical protein